ncbi:DUF6090 family protein [Maribacter sp. PR1]|uniref:DUF6090 family protein n=1 Tax=Maribacter cobaltidurans TaxID=1178778 RepID=A0ABU7J187_9FLAO|nr:MULTISPECIES: DUF6090 family protein [Maribacter]MDC6391119.1 DUF6090 family protein [Maribacter sp. PR1]MEE1978511.1 DUF6090 family protein [Maribacter cobaltidurans]
MIKFFRSIRQKMLTENKFSKYLLYAIGEIVLVVIGILIALQINNWNEARKQNTIVNTYLKGMVLDLNNDIRRFDIIIKNLNEQIKSNTLIFEDKSYQNLPIDSIVLSITSYFNDYKISDQTFQKIKNYGLANQLGSTELNDVINNYYSEDLYRFNLFIDYDEKRSIDDDDFWFVTNDYEINPVLGQSKNINLPFAENEETRKTALIQKLESNLGRNNLRNNISRKSLGINITQNLKNKAKLLKEMINKELNKK